MQIIFRLIAAVALTASASAATAQSEEAQTAMQRLTPLAGTATVEAIRHSPNGPETMPSAGARGGFTLNGHALQEDLQFEQQPGDIMTLQTNFSYDIYRDVYRIAVTDDDYGIMDIYEGRFVSDTVLIATNLRSDTHFPLGDGNRLHFQLRWDFSDEVVQFDIFLSPNGGATWRPMYEMEFTPSDG